MSGPEGKENEETDSTSRGFVERTSFVDHIHRHLNFSVFGLSFLAVPVGVLSAYGAWGFLEAFGLAGHWLHDDIGVHGGKLQLLELALGGLLFGLVLHFFKW